MIDVKIEVSSGLKKLLDPSYKNYVDEVLRKSRDELGQQVTSRIKQRGFAPRDTGKLAESHRIISKGKETWILSDRMTRNGVPLWLYIVNGHRVLTTSRSRRWWFWYLNNVLGGSYTRKTSGSAGYVPPNRYHERAIQATPITNIISKIKHELLH